MCLHISREVVSAERRGRLPGMQHCFHAGSSRVWKDAGHVPWRATAGVQPALWLWLVRMCGIRMSVCSRHEVGRPAAPLGSVSCHQLVPLPVGFSGKPDGQQEAAQQPVLPPPSGPPPGVMLLQPPAGPPPGFPEAPPGGPPVGTPGAPPGGPPGILPPPAMPPPGFIPGQDYIPPIGACCSDNG